MEIDLHGKVALVTGASKGIGKTIALRLARSGADVAVNYNRSKKEAEEVVEEIGRMGRKSMAVQTDVSDSRQVESMVERMSQAFEGRLDILVNNAGLNVYSPTDVVEMSDEEWDRILNTNLKGSFYTSRASARRMIQRGSGGRIIGIASGAGHGGRPGCAHYCASKAGLILFCKTLAIELAPHNILVNTVSVGFVGGGYYDAPDCKKIRESILPRILLQRLGSSEDVASMVTFLASEQANWITGVDFRVDGGESAGRIPLPNT